jgi:hypothetical protein
MGCNPAFYANAVATKGDADTESEGVQILCDVHAEAEETGPTINTA